MKKVEGNSIYKTSSNVLIRTEDEHGALLYNSQNNWAKVINLTGLEIWKACETGKALPDLISIIHQKYKISPDTDLTNDVSIFLNSLIDAEFLCKCHE